MKSKAEMFHFSSVTSEASSVQHVATAASDVG